MNQIDYIMGLLTADGSQKKNMTKDGIHISMTLELKDKDILDKIADIIGNKKVNIRVRNNKYTMYYMTIPYKFLLDKGQYFNKNKTGIYSYYNQCNNKLDFIRGLFDGDGGICERKRSKDGKSYWSVYFVINSHQQEIKQILDDFSQTYNFKFSIYYDKRGVGCYNYNISKQSEIKRFYQLLYKNKPELFLDRKYQKFLESGCPKMETF